MERVLAVARSDEDASVIAEADALASGVGADLVVLSVLTEEEFGNDAAVLSTIESVENVDSGGHSGEEIARDVGRDLYRDAVGALDGDGVDVLGVVTDGSPAEQVLETARREECDHIFLAGGNRSPAGKALFGDFAQSVLLGFDGFVTVEMTDE